MQAQKKEAEKKKEDGDEKKTSKEARFKPYQMPWTMPQAWMMGQQQQQQLGGMGPLQFFGQQPVSQQLPGGPASQQQAQPSVQAGQVGNIRNFLRPDTACFLFTHRDLMD
jgi:hypothetical protein